MDAAKSSLRSRNLDLNQVGNPESRAKIQLRSILWGQNPFPIQKVGLKSISDPFCGFKIHFLIWNTLFWSGKLICCPGYGSKKSISDPFLWVKIHFLIWDALFWSGKLICCPGYGSKVCVWRQFIFVFWKIVCVWYILWLYETRWLAIGYR